MGVYVDQSAEMPVNQDELLDFLCRLSDEENLRVTVKHCAKGGLITGASAMLAALFMGPVGFAVGEESIHFDYLT